MPPRPLPLSDYDRIGPGYSGTRRADPRIAAQIEAALGDAHSVLNVGAGAGSYEPTGLAVTAVEPSAEMIGQLDAGLEEMLRVARRRLVMVTFDSVALEDLWIAADYFPAMLSLSGRPARAAATWWQSCRKP